MPNELGSALPIEFIDCNIHITLNRESAVSAIDIVSDRVADWYVNFLNVDTERKNDFKNNLKKGIRFKFLNESEFSDSRTAVLEVQDRPVECGILDIFMAKLNIKLHETSFPKNSITTLCYLDSRSLQLTVMRGIEN